MGENCVCQNIVLLSLCLTPFTSNSGVLPGKSVSQLNLQTQRLLGQQATSEFMGLHLFCSRVGQKNATNITAPRKNGCIINEGAKVSSEENRKRKEENRRIYGLSQEQVDAIVLPVATVADDANTVAAKANDDQRAVADAERRLAILVATRNARAVAKTMPVRDWNAEHSLQPRLPTNESTINSTTTTVTSTSTSTSTTTTMTI
jgi:hypothetical protein